ncbi:hypothetical protein [Fulvivirga ligni]|uniref:hypothetical protein n=1 Tax=Fulvivirga ligni TaxID=2904246 RepID=UPI001F3DAD5E|nr:hypothetical protein [Fulvivirga ligni]UII19859.1 hypothetical protein LVD16_18615 [Fulvivirga ligni]
MRYLKLPLLVIMLLAFNISCKEDDDAPDPRAAYAGSYEIDEWTVKTSEAGVETVDEVDLELPLEFMINTELDNDEMKINDKEFLEGVIQRAVLMISSTVYRVDMIPGEEVIIEVSGDSFELDKMDMQFVMSLDGYPDARLLDVELSMEGKMDDYDIELEMSFDFFGYEFEIEAAGKKD